jgi:hypothetical protein
MFRLFSEMLLLNKNLTQDLHRHIFKSGDLFVTRTQSPGPPPALTYLRIALAFVKENQSTCFSKPLFTEKQSGASQAGRKFQGSSG